MTAVLKAAASGPPLYRRRRPERTLLYRTVQANFETWLALTRDGAARPDRASFRSAKDQGASQSYCDSCR